MEATKTLVMTVEGQDCQVKAGAYRILGEAESVSFEGAGICYERLIEMAGRGLCLARYCRDFEAEEEYGRPEESNGEEEYVGTAEWIDGANAAQWLRASGCAVPAGMRKDLGDPNTPTSIVDASTELVMQAAEGQAVVFQGGTYSILGEGWTTVSDKNFAIHEVLFERPSEGFFLAEKHYYWQTNEDRAAKLASSGPVDGRWDVGGGGPIEPMEALAWLSRHGDDLMSNRYRIMIQQMFLNDEVESGPANALLPPPSRRQRKRVTSTRTLDKNTDPKIKKPNAYEVYVKRVRKVLEEEAKQKGKALADVWMSGKRMISELKKVNDGKGNDTHLREQLGRMTGDGILGREDGEGYRWTGLAR